MSAALFDSNLWLALTFDKHPFHETARTVFRDCKSKSPAVFCRATEQSFLRLASTPALHATYESIGLNNHDVIGFLEDFHKLPHVIFADEAATSRNLWITLSDRQTASPKVWMDAYLAAFAISANLRFVTFDRDFLQFQSHGLNLQLLATNGS